MRRILVPLLLLGTAALASCTGAGDGRTESSGTAASTPPPAAETAAAPWKLNPSAGVVVTPGENGAFRVETGPHVILWPAGEAELAPPYTVRATLRKTTGRIHEGTGLLFGGTHLDRPEAEQGYSYFLTRGDGSFLIKLRRGAATPIVRDWTAHPAIRRDDDQGGHPNDLRVDVGTQETAFFVNGTEVARVPTAELETKGLAGLRVSHELQLEVSGFHAGPGAGAP
jgi:hypothetical protein